MVDVHPRNEQLRPRAVDIVATATGITLDEARDLLEASGYEAKTAIVMALAQIDASEARRRLAAGEGRVALALKRET